MKRCARLARGVALFLAAWLALAAAALAQPASPAPPQQQQQQTVTPETLQSLVDTINDPAARAKLVTQLQALIAAQKGEPAPPKPKPATLLETLSGEIDAVTDDILVAARIVVDAPRLMHWLK